MSGPLDPSTAARAKVTARYTDTPPPSLPNAHPKCTRLFTAILALFKAIGEDEKMARNSLQTFTTPAADKNAQYFAWDFVMRTVVRLIPQSSKATPKHKRAHLPKLPRKKFASNWINACNRGNLIASLLLDERPGYLAQMVEATCPGNNPGGQPLLSNAIIEAAEEVQRAADDGGDLPWVPNRRSQSEPF
ncbi:hypothetical protein MBLNU13_g08328t1 [Cladosporium sp. NU13]